jgi:pyruvate/2-oxoglutarate dehydrogenase complex dihydrolipoamide acyltransferase (E2) component
MGDSITEGTLVEFKPVGTFVNMDDVVAVLETDKVSRLLQSTHLYEPAIHGKLCKTVNEG